MLNVTSEYLKVAIKNEKLRVEFSDGYAMELPDIDEHIGIEGLLAGRRNGESKKSFDRWLASRQRATRIALLNRKAVSNVSH